MTHNEHIVFGYLDSPSIFRSSENDRWFVSYGPITRIPKSFREEAIIAAKLIYAAAEGSQSKKIQLFYSGGSDSEFMVRAFLAAQVPFEVIIVRFNDQLNQHDIIFAERFCESVGLKPVYLDLDIYEFFYSGLAEKYAYESQTQTPALLHHLWAIDQVNGFPVLATGEVYWVKEDRLSTNSWWKYWDEEMFFSPHRFMKKRNRVGVPAFFKYTPEFVVSMVLEPSMQDLILNKCNPKWFDSEATKHEIYKRAFPMQDLPLPGYTGFERLFMLFAEYIYILKEEKGIAIQKLHFSKLLKQLVPAHFKKDLLIYPHE